MRLHIPRKPRAFLVIILILLFSASFSIQIDASSSEGDPVPPQGGSGGGGGGGFIFYDYYIPLIFDESHADGLAKVRVTIIQPSVVITSFAMDESGVNQQIVNEPSTLEFDPFHSPGLTNGSLIRLSSPAQVTVLRDTEDKDRDISFAYSVMPDRMRGFEYRAPFDGYVSVFTEDQLTFVNVVHQNGSTVTETITAPFTTKTIPVSYGAYINTTKPTLVAFFSPDMTNGYVATMGVPKFLRGTEYIFPTSAFDLDKDEDDYSEIVIFPESPTVIEIQYPFNYKENVTIFEGSKLRLDRNIRGIKSYYADIDVQIFVRHSYGGILRSSAVQLIAAPEMRAGELFTVPIGVSSYFSVLNSNTNLTVLNYADGEYFEGMREVLIKQKFETFELPGKPVPNAVIGNHSLFGFGISHGKYGHIMAPSLSFLLLPLNTQTLYRNVSDATFTWYRFTNLAIASIDVFPEPVEEFSSLFVSVTIIANGSLPAGNFKVEIALDGKNVVEDESAFLQVNDTVTYTFRTFLNYDQKNLTLEVLVDIENEVTELNENDNNLIQTIQVVRNIRLRISMAIAIFISVAYIINRIVGRIKKYRRLKQARVDAILSVEVGDEEVEF